MDYSRLKQEALQDINEVYLEFARLQGSLTEVLAALTSYRNRLDKEYVENIVEVMQTWPECKRVQKALDDFQIKLNPFSLDMYKTVEEELAQLKVLNQIKKEDIH